MLGIIKALLRFFKNGGGSYIFNKLRLNEGNVAFAYAFVLAAALILVPEISHAEAIEDTLCTVINWLSGPIGRGIAAIAVVTLGFSLFLGKVTWGLAIALAIGIAAIFGAEEIVGLLGGDEGSCDENV